MPGVSWRGDAKLGKSGSDDERVALGAKLGRASSYLTFTSQCWLASLWVLAIIPIVCALVAVYRLFMH
jgi:hypothetical protein